MGYLCIISLAAIGSYNWNNVQMETAQNNSLEQLCTISAQRKPTHFPSILISKPNSQSQVITSKLTIYSCIGRSQHKCRLNGRPGIPISCVQMSGFLNFLLSII